MNPTTPTEDRTCGSDPHRAWNDTAVSWPDLTYVQLLRSHVEAHPDQPAIVDGRSTLTYAQLEQRSNQIAHGLVEAGVTAGDRVGLLCPRSPAFVLTVLAAMKVGAAVVPLDPVNPDTRLAAMVADAQPRLTVVAAVPRSRIPIGVATLELEQDTFEDRPTDFRAVIADADTATHLIYTSGSTGQPKAVVERHGALVNLVHWTGRAYDVAVGDRASWLSTPGFAVQLMEWMPYLPLGATIHIGDLTDVTPAGVRDWVDAQQVTHTMLVAGLAERIWGLEWPASTALRILVTTAERVHSWPPRDTPFRVVMTYGSTETTNVLTCLDIGAGIDFTAQATDDAVQATHPVPCGLPIANMRVHLLDDDDRPVPVGEVGRLHVAGHGLATGYFQRPQLTREKFRQLDLPGEPATVVYDSGDLARHRADGAIEVLGRSDSQVKIRGHRVELGEVETAITGLAEVAEAVVVTREPAQGERQLVGYVAPADVSVSAVRRHLQTLLPPYMVPGTLIALAQLPRLPNGKVDHQSLPDPVAVARSACTAELVLPRDDVEADLVRIWTRLFGVEMLGVDDSFFELGGHSLLAFRLIDEVTLTLGVQLSLPDLYDHPTVAELAVLIQGRETIGGTNFGGMPPIEPAPAQHHAPFSLTDSQQALWIGRSDAVDLGNVGCHGYFEWESPTLDIARFDVAWRRLVQRHAALRTVVLPDGTQRVLPEVPDFDIDVLDLREQSVAEAHDILQRLREHLSHQVMEDQTWPLFDVRLSLLPPDADQRSMVRIHLSLDFLIVDAWSYFQCLIPDLVSLYEDPDGLAPLSLTFRDYVIGVAERLPSSDVYQRAELYWKAKLDTLPAAPELPARPADQPVMPQRFDRVDHRLEESEWSSLKSRATELGITPSGLMTSVFAEVLRAASGHERFTINFPIFNRIPLHPEVPHLIGDTTTTLLLVVESTADTFLGRTSDLQAELWTALEHRYFSGVQVLRELMRRRGTMLPAMPIVLTSLLGHPPRHYAASLAEPIYSISQTPQVSLDFQIFEVEGALEFNWDFLPSLFPDGLIEAMFDAYCAILHRLLDDGDAWRAGTFAELEQLAPDRTASDATAGPVRRDTAQAWERYWAQIDQTGAGGEVIWDPDDPQEIARSLELARQHMSARLPVIDLGCGNGRFARALAPAFPCTIGLDVSTSAVKHAIEESEGIPRVGFEVFDATQSGAALDLAEEIGDAHVFVRGVWHILDAAERQRMADNIAELLGSRGTLICLEPQYEESAFGYIGFVGGTKGRALDLVRPLEFAGVGASMAFDGRDARALFPPEDGWEHVESCAVAMGVLDPSAGGGSLQAPGHLAIIRRR